MPHMGISDSWKAGMIYILASMILGETLEVVFTRNNLQPKTMTRSVLNTAI